MNKKCFLPALLGAFLAMPAYAQVAKDFAVSKALPIESPLIVDSVDTHGAKYQVQNLLKSQPNLKALRAEANIVSDSVVALEQPQQGYAMYVVETKLRAPQYSKGTLKVSTPAMAEVLVNGEKVTDKKTADDSICSANTITAPLTLIPEVEYVVTIKALTSADAKVAPTVKAEYVSDNESPTRIYAQGKRRMEHLDRVQGKVAARVSMSPDGKYLLTNYRDSYSKDKSRRWSTITDVKTGKVIHNNVQSGMNWMPKGSQLYYTNRTTDTYDVYTVDVPSLKQELLISGVPDGNFTWSPEADYLIYYKEDEGEPNPGPLHRYLTPDDRIPGNRARSIAMKYDVASGISYPLAYGNRSSYIADINHDGSKALLMVNEADPTQYPFYFNDLLEIDMKTMVVDTIISHDPWISRAYYSPDSKQLFIIGSPMAFDAIGGNWGNHPDPSPEDYQGYIYDIATDNVKPMTKDFNPSVDGRVTWNYGDGNIYFTASNGYNVTLYSLNPATGAIKELGAEIPNVQSFTIGDEQGQYLAYTGVTYDTVGRLYLLNLKNNQFKLLDDPWADTADQIEWGKTEQWNFTSDDGTVIEGFITYPPDFDPSQKYPMIVYYYGGCAPTQHHPQSVMGAQAYAARGYVVYTLNPSGCTGYGQEFSARHVNAWGDYTANDIITGVKKLVAEKDFINPDKVGCTGASYGGFMTQYLLTLTDIFAAAVSHAGISNVTSYWGEGNWGYSYNTIAAAKSYPWNNPDLFTKHGSLFNADKISTPLLLLHGTADDNVPPGESIQLFNALKILNRPVELITVEGENHGVLDYDKRCKWQDTYMAYFAKYLQDNPDWWESLYPDKK